MKKFLIFLAGVVVGILLAMAAGYYYGSRPATPGEENVVGTPEPEETKGIDGATFFDEPGEVMEYKSYEIFQTLGDGIGLARAESEYGNFFGPIVLVCLENEVVYDKVVVKNKDGKKFRMIGTYKYQSKDENWHTVPIISLI